MPRHSSGTGRVLPVPPLDLEEVKFWLHIMEDHALFIKTGLPYDKTDLIEEAASFEREFADLRVRADRLQGDKKFSELITDTIGSLKEFIRFKKLLLEMSLVNTLGSALPPLFFDHIIREAEYFMAILEKMREGKRFTVIQALEVDFWLRIMAEHTKFIDNRIDPSERSLLGVVRGYEDEFDDLTMQGRDYVSFFEHQSQDLPAYSRFLQDSRTATARLRDFEQAAYDMIVKNRMLSTISATMADHFRREADHFLLVLTMMEKGVIKVEREESSFKHKKPKFGVNVAAAPIESPVVIAADKGSEAVSKPVVEETIDDIALDCTPGSDRENIMQPEPKAESAGAETGAGAGDAEIVENSSKPEATEVAVKAKIVASEKLAKPSKPPAEAKDNKQAKYKWGGHWPRQLGKIKL
ncbi:DUF2935 domain-containing protein [Sporomusa aerivorans]|uniref:DUF2935 domain-containing protein n=1 Tax=Sporomusa aerivorans TaxID=204936 RepID=UPI00352BCFEE